MNRTVLRRLWLVIAALATMIFPQAVDVIDRVTDVLKAGVEVVDQASQMDSTSSEDPDEPTPRHR
jgi:hypothetical protein